MSEKLQDIREIVTKMNSEYPQLARHFLQYSRAVKDEDGALDSKTKKLIALAISASHQCEWCIALHAKQAYDMGATEAEMVEAVAVAIVLSGSPAFMKLKTLFDVLEDIKKEKK